MLPAYRQMAETWLAVGPVDELADAIATLIIGDPVLSKQWIAKWRQLPRENMGPVSDCLFEREDITDRLREITCPAIVFHGTADRSIEIEKGEQLCAALSGCTGMVHVEGGSHASNLTHPDQVNGPLVEFLRSLS
jgi:pimeloyl-ACP methyl ester carboxylesterase